MRVLLLVLFVLASAQGNAADGRKVFTKMRCDSCHSATTGRAPHPLPDMSAQPPHAIAQKIVDRKTVRDNATFDEMAMASAASRLTTRDLDDVVAYLRSR